MALIRIEQQIVEIRLLFNTKRVKDECSLGFMTDKQQMDIIEVINNEKKDGSYEIDDELKVVLNNGRVSIQDNIEDE